MFLWMMKAAYSSGADPFPVLKNLWELPAGKIDDGETATGRTRRKLSEQGYKAKSWKKLI